MVKISYSFRLRHLSAPKAINLYYTMIMMRQKFSIFCLKMIEKLCFFAPMVPSGTCEKLYAFSMRNTNLPRLENAISVEIKNNRV